MGDVPFAPASGSLNC